MADLRRSPGNTSTPLSATGSITDGSVGTATLSASIGTVTRTSSTTWRWTWNTSTPGAGTATITAADPSGQEATVSFGYTVADTTRPRITSAPSSPRIIEVNEDGTMTIPNLAAETVATDNSGTVPAITQDVSVGSIVGTASTVVTITARDAAGNEDHGYVTLSKGPSSHAPSAAIQPMGPVFATQAEARVEVSPWGNETSLVLEYGIGGAFNLQRTLTANGPKHLVNEVLTGLQPHKLYSLRAKITNANGTTTSAPITFSTGNNVPVLSGFQTALNGNEGSALSNGGTITDIDGDGITFTASTGTVTQSNGVWTWFFAAPDGPNSPIPVTVTADDGVGGVETATFTISTSNAPPRLSTYPSYATISAAANTAVSAYGRWSDSGDIVTLTADVGTVTKEAGDMWRWSWTTPSTPNLDTIITITATDDENASSSTSIRVSSNDKTAPTVNGPSIFTLTGSCVTVPDFRDRLIVTDASGVASTTQSPVAGSTLIPGNHIVTFTATDTLGNSGTQQIPLYVRAAPVFIEENTVSVNGLG